jgi:PleD family two-component response regulator
VNLHSGKEIYLMQSACIELGRDEQTRQGIVLVIEDDASVGACLVEAITQETPYIAFLVTEAQHALTVLREVKPNIILCHRGPACTHRSKGG